MHLRKKTLVLVMKSCEIVKQKSCSELVGVLLEEKFITTDGLFPPPDYQITAEIPQITHQG